jgi:protein TonB
MVKPEPVSRRRLFAAAAVALAAAVAFIVVSTLPQEPSSLLTERGEATEVVVEANGTGNGAEAVSPPPDGSGESSPGEDSTTPAGRSEEAVEPAIDKELEGDPHAWRGQGVVQRPARVVPDDPEPNVEEPSKEGGVTEAIGEGEEDPPARDQEISAQGIDTVDNPAVSQPVAEPPTPGPAGAEGEEGEEETPKERVPLAPPKRILYVEPEYPSKARWGRAEGEVLLKGVINEQGHVTELRVVRSIPLLDQAALDAVSQWKYEPTLVDGVPVRVETDFKVQFKWTR